MKPKGAIKLTSKFLVADTMLPGQYGHGIRIIESKNERIWELQIEDQKEKEEWKIALQKLADDLMRKEQLQTKKKKK